LRKSANSDIIQGHLGDFHRFSDYIVEYVEKLGILSEKEEKWL